MIDFFGLYHSLAIPKFCSVTKFFKMAWEAGNECDVLSHWVWLTVEEELKSEVYATIEAVRMIDK
jgi:hypothetical protein